MSVSIQDFWSIWNFQIGSLKCTLFSALTELIKNIFKATVMFMRTLCWWIYHGNNFSDVGDRISILVTISNVVARCQCEKIKDIGDWNGQTRHNNVGPTSKNCQQRIPFPTSVTNINVAIFHGKQFSWSFFSKTPNRYLKITHKTSVWTKIFFFYNPFYRPLSVFGVGQFLIYLVLSQNGMFRLDFGWG